MNLQFFTRSRSNPLRRLDIYTNVDVISSEPTDWVLRCHAVYSSSWNVPYDFAFLYMHV